MNKIKELTLVLFKELTRDRFYIFLYLAGGGVIFSALFPLITDLTLVERIGLPALDVLPIAVVIFWGMDLFARDTLIKNAFFMFARPIKPWEYLASGILAVSMAVMLVILVISGLLLILSFLDQGPQLEVVLTAGLFAFLRSWLLLSFGLLFSLYAPRQLAMALIVFVYAFGHGIGHVAHFLEASGNVFLKYVGTFVLPLFPNLEFFDGARELVAGQALSTSYYVHALIYAFSYSLLIFLLSLYVFSRMNLDTEYE